MEKYSIYQYKQAIVKCVQNERRQRSYCRQCYSETIGRIYLKFYMSNFPRLILENLPSEFGIDLIRNANSKFFRLPYLSRKYAFSGFEKQLHKNHGTDFHQIWHNGASYHRTDLRKIWHLSLQKCESRNFSFLFIPLTRMPMFRTAMYSRVRYFDPLVYLFIHLMKLLDVRSQNTTKIHSQWINKWN